MPDKIYCYPDSDVLKNRMGIRDMEQLKRMEGRFPSAWHTFFRKSMPCTPSVKATDAASVSLSEP